MGTTQVVKMQTVSFAGMDPLKVEVEVQISSGLPKFVIVGLPDAIVNESKIRISRALSAALPAKAITINLAPADIKKEGSHYDLPIAICLLVALNILPHSVTQDYIAFGELSLDGRILPSRGVLLATMFAQELNKGMICSLDCAKEASIIGSQVDILAPKSLTELVNYFKNEGTIKKPGLNLSPDTNLTGSNSHSMRTYNTNESDSNVENINEEELDKELEQELDFLQVKGQEGAKLALEIAASGGHHVLLVGPPGAGKSMLASRFTTILPELDPETALDATIIHNLAGKLKNQTLIRKPVWRDPHHSSSMPALVGGGANAMPGEISLAHGGVLFLDEFPEFSRQALQALREAMETGKISVSRAQAHYTYPARFQLIAAMNPCKCGMFGERACLAGARCAKSYWEKISGPLLDRFDLCVTMQSLKPWELSEIKQTGNTSAEIKARVIACRKRQMQRQGCLNAVIDQRQFDVHMAIDEALVPTLHDIAKKYELSARGMSKLVKVARTIADLRMSEKIAKEDLLQAASFRFVWQW